MKSELLLIIPAYNEEACIAQTISSLRSYPYDFVVVNDGSCDDTGRLCEEMGVRVIQLPFNMGLAGAFQAGMQYAYNHGYSYAMQFDADGQHLPQYIAPMLEKISEGYDIVVGSRYIEKKRKVSARGMGSSLIRWILRLTTGKILTDPTSGMRIYSKKIVAMFANRLNYGPEPDTLAYLLRNGVEVCEVPVEMRDRIAGKSYFTLLSSIKYMCRMSLSILLIQFVRPRMRKEME